MTDIDHKSDIELHTANEHVIVRVPLAGPVTDEWLRCYERLAHATGVPVQARADPVSKVEVVRTGIGVEKRCDATRPLG
jgi:hypothetical protein